MKRLTFRWADRIHLRRDFRAVLKNGKRTVTPQLLVWRLPRPVEAFQDDRPRLGLVISRRYGNAVKRNRIKRFIRETFRTHKHDFPRGVDLIVQPKTPGRPSTYQEVEAELLRACGVIE